MDVYKAIINRRSIRTFQRRLLSRGNLKRLVNAARLAPSAGNLQPLEFVIADDQKLCAKIFPHLHWAVYIHPLRTPAVNQRPAAYIIILVNLKKAREEFSSYDVGAAAENMLLTSRSLGIGSCWMYSIDRAALAKILKIPAFLRVDSVISLGYPNESPKIAHFAGSVKYYLDSHNILHVPKRSLAEIIHYNRYGKRGGN